MDSHPVPDFEALIARIAAALQARNIPFMLIGGQAVLLHGEPRLTQDIDITLGVSPDRLQTVLDACTSAQLTALPEDVPGFVRDTFVLPAAAASGIRVDFIFSTTPYEAVAIDRAVTVEICGTAVPFATAEDLVLHKLFAGRPRDIEDAKGVVRRKGDGLDWEYLGRWAREFGAVPGREDLPVAVTRLREGD
ncbi:MAG: nucleotidyltransferase family protein [Gemmatimonadetes bacterium]|nr:nucleotidyltransferase family protein [Gemmatimonadota bacterium]